MVDTKSTLALSEARPALSRTVTKRRIDSSLIESTPVSPTAAPNLYDLLLDMGRRVVLTVPVPECLIQTRPDSSPFLIASEKGALSVSHGSYAFNKFFELVDVAVSVSVTRDMVIQLPKYIVQTGQSRSVLCMTKEDCIALISRRDGTQTCYVSRYVKAKGTKPAVHRVTFRGGQGLSLFLLKNNRCKESERRRHTEIRKASFPARQISIYQHKATDFMYAGKLLKTSFSPYLPYKSTLETHSAKVSPVLSPKPTRKAERIPPLYSPPARKRATETMLYESDFIVDTKDLRNCKVFAIEDRMPDLETIALGFVETLERGYKTKTVAKLTLDCILSADGTWFLVECVELVWEESGKQQRQAVGVKTKFESIEKVHLTLPDLKPLDIPHFESSQGKEGSRSPVRKMTPLSSPLSRLYASEENLMKSHLQVVQNKYDDLLTEVRRSKVLSRDLVADLSSLHHSSQHMEQVLESALLTFSPSDAQLSKKEFEAKKEALLEVLSGKFRNLLKSTKMKMHAKLGMTSAQYEAFLQVVIQEALKTNMPEANLESMIDRLRFFVL